MKRRALLLSFMGMLLSPVAARKAEEELYWACCVAAKKHGRQHPFDFSAEMNGQRASIAFKEFYDGESIEYYTNIELPGAVLTIPHIVSAIYDSW
jgi:hypothetical protein